MDRNSGFTLIEVSIVLVIIGLIVGGILAGNELVRTAKVRSMIKEVNQLATAVNAFRGKYNCLPGDCRNATQFFGTAADCYLEMDSTGTCNGDGDGLILTSNFWSGGEHVWMGHQLKLAGLTDLPLSQPNNLTVQNSGYPIFLPGKNVLGSNVEKNIGYTIAPMLDGWIDSSGSPGMCSFSGSPAMRGNQITMGGQTIYFPYLHGKSGTELHATISGMQAYGIDAKIDDGHPAKGKVVVPIYWHWTDITNMPACDASFGDNQTYTLTDEKQRGGLMFLSGF
jgi:prepilin-type N-terminal cleavage/methylation domain-containing protein